MPEHTSYAYGSSHVNVILTLDVRKVEVVGCVLLSVFCQFFSFEHINLFPSEVQSQDLRRMLSLDVVFAFSILCSAAQ